jgi:hypothetical protein
VNHRFQPGETVTNERFALFEPVLPRVAGEPDASYAARLEQKGLAYSITSAECRDIQHFKNVLSAARHDGLPVAVVTDAIRGLATERAAERGAKSPEQWLQEARAGSRPTT